MTTYFKPLTSEQAPAEAKQRLINAEKANGFSSNLLGVRICTYCNRNVPHRFRNQ